MNQILVGAPDVDLDAYCARIEYDGPRAPTLAVLRELHRRHPAAIPFEGIEVLLGRDVPLDTASLQAKLIIGGRGGYCFEQNLLLHDVLTAMGFEVAALIARSRWGRPLSVVRARSHVALRVRLEGEDWLADVASRAMMTAPIRMAERGAQATDFEPLRLTPVDGELRLEMQMGGDWAPIYDCLLAPQHDADIVAANWFTATHPSSPFRQRLFVWKSAGGVRRILIDNLLETCWPGREPRRARLDVDALEACLAEDFGLRPEPAWRPMIERAVAAGDAQERRD
jgi:N-hydroxyarylamine O-acetyltransferase